MTLSYCADLVRTYDRDRFLLSLTVPPDKRAALWALFAFNHEIAKTREIVTETQLGLIRLQWWRDAIAAVYEGTPVPSHEVMDDLVSAITKHDLPREWFDNLIYAREFDLEGVAPASLEGLENYADFTATPLNKLALAVLGEQEGDITIRHLSIAYALSGLLRAVPYHKAQGRSYLPADNPDITRIVDKAEQHLEKAEKPDCRYLRGIQKLTRLYLKRIRRADYDLSSSSIHKPPISLYLKVFFGVV